MNKFDLNSYLSSKRKQIDNALGVIIENYSKDSKIKTAMEYSLMSSGKRLRPILCIAAAETVGSHLDDTMRAACAIEMIHTYSLIHDDLPAMDNDNLRRGQPTCHIQFDEATAILAGDALLTLAFEILSSVESADKDHAFNRLRAIHTIAMAAGCKGMIEGQMQDIAAEGNVLGLEDLKKMHRLKTGALIEASVIAGTILVNGNRDQIKKLKNYARNIGLAFQITDDILNVEGDPDIMGKDVGTDQARGKSTYPSILGMEKSKIFVKKLVNDALKVLDYFDNKADPLRAIAHYIVDRNK
ncbi:MAG: polyprenyl synthetase family protein [Deltaproteobacteria bacterium]|nr:polyprenyl synthetase family protein [Deltaproteobacteria bacterium]